MTKRLRPLANPEGDSINIHVADATRADLIQALIAMPDEAFGWFVVWASGQMMQFPDGLGGFAPASREAITSLRAAAKHYLDNYAERHR